MDELRTKYLTAISEASDEASLEALRVQAIGKKGEISLEMRSLGKMTPEERQVAGPALNALKDEINAALDGLTYTPNNNFAGRSVLTVSIGDNGKTEGLHTRQLSVFRVFSYFNFGASYVNLQSLPQEKYT